MVSFWVYDVTFLVIFTIAVFLFIRTRKENLKCEARYLGIPFYMYRTQAGVNFINWTGENCKRFLHSIKYLIIAVGYALMGLIVWMLGRTLFLYISVPQLTEVIKAPPIAPLIPYFPKLFGMESFFPPFYFTYFLVAIAIVMIVHEFAHGIYMKLFKIKIKSTGLVFFGPMLGAFVEQDDKSFEDKPKTEQMTVLAAGVFANVITALFFFLVYITLFSLLFVPVGYQFNSYAAIPNVPIPLIDEIGEDIDEHLVIYGGGINTIKLTEVTINETKFLAPTRVRELAEEGNFNYSVPLFFDAPAIRSSLSGAITEANGVKIQNEADLQEFMKDKNPGDTVTFKTIQKGGLITEYEIILGEHPTNESRPFIGISFFENTPKNQFQYFTYRFMTNVGSTSPFSESTTYYEPIIAKDFVYFIYLMLWWIILINFFVAIFNMVPVGIFDGGRFFYLTVLGITKSEKTARAAYKFSTYAIIAFLIGMMFFWAIRVIPRYFGFSLF